MSGMKSTEAHRGHKLSLPSCHFRVVAPFQGDWTSGITKWLNGGGRGVLVVQITKMLILLF